jgi:hypothetical protein
MKLPTHATIWWCLCKTKGVLPVGQVIEFSAVYLDDSGDLWHCKRCEQGAWDAMAEDWTDDFFHMKEFEPSFRAAIESTERG